MILSDLVSLLWEGSLGVMDKVVPVQRVPESHKVSVVLLKCCSILFICKCCNLSVNVVNTNEKRRGGKPPTFLRGQKRAPEPCPKITHLTSGGARVIESTRMCLLTALKLTHTDACLFAKPANPDGQLFTKGHDVSISCKQQQCFSAWRECGSVVALVSVGV